MIGRNDPCPCGSGKKYKKCHLDERPGRRPVPEGISHWHARDDRLSAVIVEYRHRKFPDVPILLPGDPDDPLMRQLSAAWCVYVDEVEGKTALEWFLDERGDSVGGDDRELLEAQRRAWFSMWRVDGSDPARGLTSVTDMITGVKRSVHDVSLSRQAKVDTFILGRVVDIGGESIFAGSHPRSKKPTDVAEIIVRFYEASGLQPPVAASKLRGKIAELLLDLWEEEPPAQELDPDRVLMRGEIFTISDPDDARRRLLAIPGARAERDGISLTERSGRLGLKRKVIADAILRDTELRVAVEGENDASAIREIVAEALGPSGRFATEEEFRVRDMLAVIEATDHAYGGREPMTLTKEQRRWAYLAWLDKPVAVFHDLTPRQAFATGAARHAVFLALTRFKFVEESFPPGQRVDIEELVETLDEQPG
jgi:hypothetical protein